MRFPPGTNSAAEISRLELDLLKANAKKYYIAAARELHMSQRYVSQARTDRAWRKPEPKVLANLEYAQLYYQLAVAKNNPPGGHLGY